MLHEVASIIGRFLLNGVLLLRTAQSPERRLVAWNTVGGAAACWSAGRQVEDIGHLLEDIGHFLGRLGGLAHAPRRVGAQGQVLSMPLDFADIKLSEKPFVSGSPHVFPDSLRLHFEDFKLGHVLKVAPDFRWTISLVSRGEIHTREVEISALDCADAICGRIWQVVKDSDKELDEDPLDSDHIPAEGLLNDLAFVLYKSRVVFVCNQGLYVHKAGLCG